MLKNNLTICRKGEEKVDKDTTMFGYCPICVKTMKLEIEDKIMKEKIKNLNKAWKLIKEAIQIIESEFKDDKYWSIQTFIEIFKKDNDRLQKSIYQKLQIDYIDDEFDKMMKRLEKDGL